jgi:hypothetical protein
MESSKSRLNTAWLEIATCLADVKSPYNDGWTASSCKRDLYVLKCWLDEQYSRLPRFVDEDQWEKERIINILKEK